MVAGLQLVLLDPLSYTRLLSIRDPMRLGCKADWLVQSSLLLPVHTLSCHLVCACSCCLALPALQPRLRNLKVQKEPRTLRCAVLWPVLEEAAPLSFLFCEHRGRSTGGSLS